MGKGKGKRVPQVDAYSIWAARESICTPPAQPTPTEMHRMHKKFDEGCERRSIPSIAVETASAMRYELSEIMRRMGELPAASGVRTPKNVRGRGIH